MVDTFRGQIRIRKWPRKRGTPKSQAVRNQNQWFKEANEIAKRVEPTQMNLAIEMTKGTGLYPRDLLLRQQAGGIYEMIESDGTSPQHRRYFRDKVMFQGAALELAANQAIPATTFTTLTWPLPTLDTAGFWNAGSPTKLTIPAGIEIVDLNAAVVCNNPAGAVEVLIDIAKNGTRQNRSICNVNANPAVSVSRGPQPVVAGDFFELQVWSSVAVNVLGPGWCYFTINVLQAT